MCVTFLYTDPTATTASAIPYKLVLVNNRDETFARPTGKPQWHGEGDDVIYAEDRVAHGTWLAVGRDGTIGNLLNVPHKGEVPHAKSRGSLAIDVVRCPSSFADGSFEFDKYNGFKLLHVDDRCHVQLISNRQSTPSVVEPGFCGFGNNTGEMAVFRKVGESVPIFETVVRGAAKIDRRAMHQQLLQFLSRKDKYLPDASLISHYSSEALATDLASIFVQHAGIYGTRSQTVVSIGVADDVHVTQRTLLQPHLDDEGEREMQEFVFNRAKL